MTIRDHSETLRLEQMDFESMRRLYAPCYDVKVTRRKLEAEAGSVEACLLYCDGMTDTFAINDYILAHLQSMLKQLPQDMRETPRDLELQFQYHGSDSSLQTITTAVFDGRLVVFLLENKQAYSIDVSKIPQRTTEESTSEVSVKGPRDGFIEDVNVNVALIRKRVRSVSLAHERFIIGTRSHTKVSLLYLDDVANPEWVEQARERLQGIETEVLANSQQLDEYLTGQAYTLFPLIDYIGRPDYVVHALERGRLIFLMDGTPLALIAPVNFDMLLKSPEDAYFPSYFVVFERALRMVGLFGSILLPGFWVALSAFNMNQLPFTLLTTITVSRIGLPLPTPLEAILMLALFEIFREAGVRLPKAVGQTVAVVGGLIIGETAINAGLTSPTMLVVTSISAISSFLLVNQSLSATVSILRLYVLLWSSFMGIFGWFISFFSIVLYLARLHSFDLPYLAPYSPARFRDALHGWGFIAQSRNKKRMHMLKTKHDKR